MSPRKQTKTYSCEKCEEFDDKTSMIIKVATVKAIAVTISLTIATVGAVLTFGATWKDLPEKVKAQDIKIDQFKVDVHATLEAIKKERAQDREILIRIDERVKRLDNKANGK